MRIKVTHPQRNNLVQILSFLCIAVLLLTVPAFAKDKNADIDISSSGIYATGAHQMTYMELSVADPSGQIIFDIHSDGSPIAWTIPAGAPDGFYSYEVRLGKEPKKEKRENNNRQGLGPKIKAEIESGTLLIENGSIVLPTGAETSLLDAILSTGNYALNSIIDFIVAPAAADQVILDDLIVDGSTCVGQDCVNGESFGFDTIRLKENNLRIKFQDTSNSASFPSRDWQITINDSSNGGANKFSIDDIDGGRTPFTIEAGAPSHSLYVDDGGRIGLGTSTPVVDLHIKTGNTPTVRLEQDGTSGFAPQTWDVAGNEANFFIRDASNGSTLPFRIFPGAPSNAISIEGTTGDVGIGTTTPTANLHIKETATADATLFLVEGKAEPTLADETRILMVENNHKVTVFGNLELGSSKKLKNNIESLGTNEALQTVAMLRPVKFQYKASPNEDTVGFIAEEVPDLVATTSRKSISTMDVVAVLTKVVQEQQKAIDELNKTIARLTARVERNQNAHSPQIVQ